MYTREQILGDRRNANEVVGVLKALADATRLRLMVQLAEAPEEGIPALDLQNGTGLSQPTVSHHLRILSEAGLVKARKDGIYSYYSLTANGAKDILDEVRALVVNEPASRRRRQ